jgi:hypothetical protein
MSMSLEDALLNVWRQSLAETKKTVTLECGFRGMVINDSRTISKERAFRFGQPQSEN